MVVADLLALSIRGKTKRTALIVDPALQAVGGHHYASAERLAVELFASGAECGVLCAAKADQAVVDTLKADRCFSETIYGRTDPGMLEFERRARVLSKELARAVRWNCPDLLVLPTCDQVLLYAVALCIRSIGRGWQPRILAWFLYPPDDAAANAEYRVAASALKASLRSTAQLHACCETSAAKRVFEDCLHFSLEKRPGPSPVRGVIADRGTDVGAGLRTPVIACVGHANIGKGYAQLPDALSLAIVENKRLAFKVHGFIDRRDTVQDHETFLKLAALGPAVSVYNRVLTTPEYQAFIAAADILLLPYVPKVYRSRGSGVFNEAERLGKPVIAPRDCTFAEDAFGENRAVPIEGEGSRAIADAIAEAVRALSHLEGEAIAYARGRTDDLRQLLTRLLSVNHELC